MTFSLNKIISIFLAETPTSISITSPVQVYLSYDNPNRNYSIPVTVYESINTSVLFNTNGTSSVAFNGQNIFVGIPSNRTSFVNIR